MFQVLIVDDERHILDSMTATIPWRDCKVDQVFTAASYDDAVEVLQEQSIDILFTDIKMPGKNGLELLEYVQSRFPAIRCIVLTGYADFSYAKAALRAKALDYLLKPATDQEIMEVLSRAATDLEAQWRFTASPEQAQRAMLEDLPQLKAGLLKELLHEEDTDAQRVRALCQRYQLDFDLDRQTCLLVFRRDDRVVQKVFSSTEWYEFLGLLEKAAPSHRRWTASDSHGYLLCLLGAVSAAPEAVFPSAVLVAEQCQRMAKSVLGMTVSVAVGEERRFPSSLHQDYRLAQLALSQQSEVPGAFCFGLPPVSSTGGVSELYAPPEFRELLETGQWDSAEQRLSEVFEKLGRQKELSWSTLMEVQSYLSYCFLRLSQEHSLPQDWDWTDSSRTLFSVKVWALRKLRSFQQALQQSEPHLRKDLIERLHQYIDENLAHDVSLQTLADHLGLTPAYLSRLHKAATGQNLSDYLLDLRMKKAAYDLRHTDKLIYQITQELGLQNPQYFSKLFQSRFGLKPQDYRMEKK